MRAPLQAGGRSLGEGLMFSISLEEKKKQVLGKYGDLTFCVFLFAATELRSGWKLERLFLLFSVVTAAVLFTTAEE